MAWERRGGRRFFYRSVKRGGKVTKEYYGAGPAAELAAQLVSQARAARAAAAAALQAERQRHERLDRFTNDLDAACRRLTEATLLAAGFRRVNYEWKSHDGRPRQVADRTGTPGSMSSWRAPAGASRVRRTRSAMRWTARRRSGSAPATWRRTPSGRGSA
jgi:hypothetical protein